MEAVRGHLTPLGSAAAEGGLIIYECGTFSDSGHEWLAVVTETGAGTHEAQNAANQAYSDFGSSSEANLQERLGLDELPKDILPRLAKLQPVLLILDQLDALAGYLDLRTARLSILLSLVRRLSRIENVHIVMSSRTFEFEHDVRLRAASSECLLLQLPALSRILALLEQRGIHAAGWPPDAQELMRTPQALVTYLQLERPQDAEPFASYQHMLDYLWNERILTRDGGARRGRFATEIANEMADNESLWLASARFDDRVDDIAALEAEGVLTTSNGKLGFTHQTVFEHALARSFASGKGRLSGFALERQSSLFLRPKLWTGLTYLRDAERSAYHNELETMWHAPSLRAHLRFLLIDFLGHERDPTDREALLMEGALSVPELRPRAYRALRGSPGWFERFSHTFIAEGMGECDETVDLMMGVLDRAWSFAPDVVAELLRERWVSNPCHDGRTWWVLQDASCWTEATLKMACCIVGRSEIAPFAMDHAVGHIGVEQPEAALRLVRARLDHELAVAEKRADELAREALRELIEREQSWETLPTLAERAPAAFLEVLWPWFEQCLGALEDRSEQKDGSISYALAHDADFRFEQENDLDLPPPTLLDALRAAAERLAETDPDAWLDWTERIGKLDVMPAQRLIAHGFAHAPERFAAPALAFLLDDTRRYTLGSSSGLTATSARLVEAASNHWSDHEVELFEATVKGYKPLIPSGQSEAVERRSWNRIVRRVRLSLLRALPQHRLTAKARRQVEQEERIFPDLRLGARFTGVQEIGPLMNAAAIAKAADEDVINAFRTLPDSTEWDHPRRFTAGGNIQLSRAFAEFSGTNPKRACGLLRLLEPENGTRAAGYALDAMSERAEPSQVLELLHEVVARGFDSEEFRASASRAVTKLLNRKTRIDDRTVDLLESWLHAPMAEEATTDQGGFNAGTAAAAESDDVEAEEQEYGPQRSLLWGHGGVFIVPGGEYPILEALIRIRLARGDHTRVDEMLFDYLDRCKDPKRWNHLLLFLPQPHSTSQDRRAALLERLFDEVTAVVESSPAARVLASAHWWNDALADSQLDRWRGSASRSARQAYGEIVAVTHLMKPTLDWPRKRLEALVGDKMLADARAGAALTCAHLWRDSSLGSRAADLLLRLMVEDDAEVWIAASEVFRLVEELVPGHATASLLSKLAENPDKVPRTNAHFVAERLGKLLPHHAELVGRVARSFVQHWRTELGDIRTSTALAAREFVDLAVTLHRLGPQTRELGTELFEQLIEIDAHEARETMNQIDNRFLDKAPARRPRLPRRRKARGHRKRHHHFT